MERSDSKCMVYTQTNLKSGERQEVENKRTRSIVVAFGEVLFFSLELLQCMLHPHHRVVEIAIIVRYASHVDAVFHWQCTF